MARKRIPEWLVLIVAAVLSAVYIFLGNRASKEGMDRIVSLYAQSRPVTLTVTSIEDEHYEKVMYPEFESPDQVILFSARISSGLRRGTVVWAIQVIDLMYDEYTPAVREGDRIIAYENRYDEASGVEYMFSRYRRTGFLTFLFILFALLLIVLGRKKGMKTLLSLTFTVLAVFCVFIPRALTGKNMYLWSVSVSVFITVMTLVINNSLSTKSAAAIAGCVCGVGTAGLLSLIADRMMRMTGFINEESIYLIGIDPANPLDLRAVMFAGVIFGALGAVMDVAVSLASSLSEIRRQAEGIGASALFRSGLNIGQDMMGTMSNTLILAYIGSSLTVAILLTAYNSSSLLALINSEMIRAEILQALAGSIGILLTIPLTSRICSLLYTQRGLKTDDR